MRFGGLLVLCAAVQTACAPSRPVASLEEAAARACARIDGVLARPERPRERKQTPRAGERETLAFWYYEHPIMSAAFAERPSSSDDNVQALHLGPWELAVQKLVVGFATDDLPDVAVVKRHLLPQLYDAGRIRALDEVLPQALIDDFRDEVREDFTYDARLIALPADGFCSVLFYNTATIGDVPPRTWPYLEAYVRARTGHGRDAARVVGNYPYVEALWSAGGEVVRDGRCALGTAEGLRAFEFVLTVGTAAPMSADRFMESGGDMTVDSSRYFPSTSAYAYKYDIAPVPGETGAVSRRSDDAVVVFARGEPVSNETLNRFVDWLTGSEVMGDSAARLGSVPVRRSVKAAVVPALEEAYRAGRATPLLPGWAEIEFEVERAVADVRRTLRETRSPE